jgi:hypothetical protein
MALRYNNALYHEVSTDNGHRNSYNQHYTP